MALTHAILAVLQEEPCSGYDLMKRFDGSVGFFWQASHQQVYRELSKLESLGLLQAEEVRQPQRSDKKPHKKIYCLTDQGVKYLREWILQPGAVSPTRDELLVKTFAGHLVEWSAFKALLEQQRGQHLERLAVYRRIQVQFFAQPQTLPRHALFHYATLRNGIRYEEAWLAWCEEMLDFLPPQD